jgi:hypothetical protein
MHNRHILVGEGQRRYHLQLSLNSLRLPFPSALVICGLWTVVLPHHTSAAVRLETQQIKISKGARAPYPKLTRCRIMTYIHDAIVNQDMKRRTIDNQDRGNPDSMQYYDRMLNFV